jgi:hypothetical protein
LTELIPRFRRFLVALSGAHTQTLDLVPSERTRFENLGWTILITSGMAVVSMWFALSSAMGLNGILAIPPALLWGLVIMGIDRWLITSIPITGNRKLAMALPRFALALLLGTLISTPFVLRIFESEINAQIAVIQQKSYNAYLQQQQSSAVAKQVSTYKAELQQVETEIASHGASTGNTASDPQLVAYNTQLNTLDGELSHWTTLKAKYYSEYICQLYGGPTCPKKGDGPAAKDSQQNYRAASQQVTTIDSQINRVQAEIQTRDKQLNSNSAASQQARYQQALSALPLVQNEYNTAVERQNQLQATYFAQEQASHGILIRLEALSQLSNGNFTVAAARFLLFLLFLVIECLPVTVKLLQRPGLYEEAMLHAREHERDDVRQFYNGAPGIRQQWVTASQAPAVAHGRVERAPLPEVRSIWDPNQPPTRMLPRSISDQEEPGGTERIRYERPEGAEQSAEYPPSEFDPAPAYGWRHSVDAGQRQDDPDPRADAWQEGQSWRDRLEIDVRANEAGGSFWEEQTRDQRTEQTRQEPAYASEATRTDARPPESGQRAGARRPDETRSDHDALADMDDEPVSARSDGSGIPLIWDDDE